ncbi:molybdate ABC transporter permease subunit [Lachnoanaerobaculum sp. JCM 36186]|jgi:molybdate ABC transporter, permease protein|uniref:molybdate ABC transporter permease subunit n=1 Tax=Lachnoanaerobaculum TaxID=1164882 RepID=UPI00027A54E6|nr:MULTISPECIES: molybdate ABC transporter permease subunit [unclassified Lachnoanaerobaculum]EJP22556.1 molybdate ABC transporter, permease protein [Lachnoanaerobaculum sp. ICM7]GMO02683.1 molybdate ABC transporter permease subunit [Lachnoanaerobaculum sp. JCM 36186]
MNNVLAHLDWSPFFITLKIGLLSTIICFFLGVGLAYVSLYMNKRIMAIFDSILTLPMVLPPTVVGFFLLLIFSRRRPVGIFLYSNFHIKIVQSFIGCVLAAFIIAFPLMYKNAKSAFLQLDKNLIYAGRTLGLSEFQIFFKVVCPITSPSLFSGAILSFARAIGEYGATSMLAGNISGKTSTISQQIAYLVQNQSYLEAGIWVGIVLFIAFLIMLLMEYIQR